MQAHQIATADFLDILFEEKNKLYGAYLLRKEYNKRLTIALLTTTAISCLLVTVFYLTRENHKSTVKPKVIADVFLSNDMLPDDPVVEPPPPPPPAPAQKTASIPFTTLQIIKDKDVSRADQPPAVGDLENTPIGLIAQPGAETDIVAPPLTQRNGVITAPSRPANEPDGMIPVEIESTFPGGMAAWKRYLLKTVKYPTAAQQALVQGPVIVKFIVNESGAVSDVQAISGPDELKEEAIRVIRMSGKWTPAIQNGRHVKSYKQQVIVFALSEE